ncbi:WXG100 family type VII secretion target [Mycobacterium kyorinense]|uniref:WXG100 family type VII secretion target n=1 Tax=Mycobacterium kyorinense TaxID=487514 RepID=UPI000B1C293A|nr:hypothetical protein [Mycobacterium kyorinense]
MAVSLADVDRWDVGLIRQVSTALGKRGGSANEVKTGLSRLPLIASWQGTAGDAAKASLDKLSTHLAAHADEMQAVGTAISKSADEIQNVKDALSSIDRDAHTWGFTIDRATGTVTPSDGLDMDHPSNQQHQVELEARIKKVLVDGNTADADLARAITTAGHDATGQPDRTIQAVDFRQSGPPHVDPLEEILKTYQVSEDPDGELDWEPPWPLSLATDPVHVTAREARMLGKLSPFALRDLNQIKEAAAVEAKVRFPPQNGPNDTADNHTDAFRHAYWNALMTQRFGENWTRDFTTAHERLPNNPATAEAMDLYNNEVGRKIAAANPHATPAQLADLVQQAVNRGDTVVIAPGGEKLAWSDTIPWGDAGTTTKASVPGQAPIATGAGPGGSYDPGQPGGYGTSAGGY